MEIPNHGLRRELRLRDLVPMQIVMIVALGWTGFAAKQGSSQIVLWLLAIVLFYLPLAAVVMKLSREIPIEGGVYQWVRTGVSPFAGFMAGWCAGIGQIGIFASVGSQMAGGFADAGGAGGAWMAANKPFILAMTLSVCAIALIVNVRGLRAAKWLSGAASLLMVATFLVMLYLLARGLAGGHAGFSLALPAFSIGTLGVFSKMALGGLTGFECSAVFSEECRRPENDVARSVAIAGPLIAFMYILGTSALLAWTPPADIDLAAPVGQLVKAGFGGDGTGRVLAVTTVCGFNLALLSACVIVVGMVARLPMVAGWDGLMPGWWSELHPRYRTPVKAIAAVTAGILLMGLLSLVGADNQEAAQATLSAGLGAFCLEYMLLFGAVAFGFPGPGRPSFAIRIAALAAFLVSLVSLIFQLLASGEVGDPRVFAVKVGIAILATNGLGALLYWRAART